MSCVLAWNNITSEHGRLRRHPHHMAEAYRAIGDDDEALLILEQGLENTEDKAILEMLSALSIETNRLSQHFTQS